MGHGLHINIIRQTARSAGTFSDLVSTTPSVGTIQAAQACAVKELVPATAPVARPAAACRRLAAPEAGGMLQLVELEIRWLSLRIQIQQLLCIFGVQHVELKQTEAGTVHS